MEGFDMLTPLFEAQDDFPQIEEMISSKYGIPKDARMVINELGNNTQGITDIQGELAELGITEPVGDIRKKYADPVKYVMELQQSQSIDEPDKVLKLLMAGYSCWEKYEAALAIVAHPEEHDYISDNVEPDFTVEHTPTVISLVEYIRLRAMGTMTYGSAFGIGRSDAAQEAIKTGTTVSFQENDYNEFFNYNATTSSIVDKLPVAIKDYIALASRKYLLGILRIAFEDLGLMGYLYHKYNDIARALAHLGIRISEQFSAAKLEFFGKKVVPIIILRDTLARSEPGKSFTKADMGKVLKYLGKDMVNVIRDTVEPLDVVLDANFATTDGKKLNFADLTDIADSGDVQESEVVKGARQAPNGEEYTYSPEEGDTPNITSGTQLAKTGDGDLECAAYKTGRWYVVYIPDKEHSAHGWFHFPEASNTRPDKRFYFKGNDGRKSGVGLWCIVYNTNTYWSNYIKDDCNDYVYYLIREDALDEEVLSLGDFDSRYNESAVGCVFSGINGSYCGRQREHGIINWDDCIISRGDDYIHHDGQYYYDWDNYAPPNMLPWVSSNEMYNQYNLTIFALHLIGKWDTSVTGEENIVAKVRELSATWFPDHGGEIRETKHGIPSIHVPDMGTAAMVLNAGPREQSEARANSLGAGSMTINLDGTEYKIGAVRPASSDNQLNQLWIFKPADMGEEELTDDVKCLVFECNTDTGKFKPRFSAPIEYGKIGEQVNEAKSPAPSEDRYTADTGDTEVTWFRPTKGKARNNRVGWGKDNSIWVSDGEHTENVGKWHIPYPEMAGGIESLPMTFIKVEGGVNLIAMNPVNNHVFAVGYVRRGVCHMYTPKATTRYGTMVLEDTETHKYTIGDPLGEVKRFNRDQYEAYIYISTTGAYVDGTGLSAEGLERVAEGHRGEIGLVIPNGRYGEKGNFSGGVGIVHWYTAETVGGNYGAETVLEISDLRTDGRKPPFYGDL